MSNLIFTPKWNNTINQVEAGEEIAGGIDGTANIATRQLAENIFYLKDNLFQLAGNIPSDNSGAVSDLQDKVQIEFDKITAEIIQTNNQIIKESQDRINEVKAAKDLIVQEAKDRLAEVNKINSALNDEINARIAAILLESQIRQHELLAITSQYEAAIAAESMLTNDKLIKAAEELNATIAALGSRVDTTISGLELGITQTTTEIKNTVEHNTTVLTGLKTEFDSNKAAVVNEFIAISNEISATASQLIALKVETDGTKADLLEFKETTATKDLATSQKITSIETEVAENKSSFQQQIKSVSDVNSAQTIELTALKSSVGTAQADIIQNKKTAADATQAVSVLATTLRTDFNNNKVIVDSELLAISNANSALASKIDTLKTETEASLSQIINKQLSAADETRAITTSLETLRTQYDKSTADFTNQIISISEKNQSNVSQLTELRAQLTGGYDGTNIDAITTGLLHQLKTIQVTDKEAIIEQIGLLSAGIGEQFDSKEIWHFTDDSEGWISGVHLPEGWLKVTNETISSPEFDLHGSAYHHIKFRLEKVGNPIWEGKLNYNLPAINEVLIPEPKFDENGISIVDIDMKWIGKITNISLKLGSFGDAANYYKLDWFAIGAPSPGASSSALLELKRTTATKDESLALSITGLNAKLNTNTAELESYINEKSEALTTTQQSQAAKILELSSSIDNVNTTLTSKISQNYDTLTTKDSALASSIFALQTKTDNASAVFTEQIANLTTIDKALTQKVDLLTADFLTSNAEIALQHKAFADKDTALTTQLSALTSKVDNNEAAVLLKIDNLVNQNAADALKFEAITSKFLNVDKELGLNAADITAERNARTTADSALSTSIDTLQTKVGDNLATVTTLIKANTDELGAQSLRLDTFIGEYDSNTALNALKIQSLVDADKALSDRITILNTDFNGNTTKVNTALSSLTDETKALGTSITSLRSEYTTNKAIVLQQLETLATADSATTTKIDGISASFAVLDGKVDANNLAINKNTADILTESTTRAAENLATAAEITTIKSEVSGNKAEVNNRINTIATEVTAHSEDLKTVKSDIAGNKATINSNFETLTNLTSAQASKIESISAELEGGYTNKSSFATKNKSIANTRTVALARATFNAVEYTRDLEASFNNNATAVNESINILSNNYQTSAEKIEKISTDFTTEKSFTRGEIQSLKTIISNDSSSTAIIIDGIKTEFNEKLNTTNSNLSATNSRIDTVVKSISDINGSLASQETTLRAEFDRKLLNEETNRNNALIAEEQARIAAIQLEQKTRGDAITAEQLARDNALIAESQKRIEALNIEKTARDAAILVERNARLADIAKEQLDRNNAITGVSNIVTKAAADIKTLESSITNLEGSFTTKTDNIIAEVSGITIGGRNLLSLNENNWEKGWWNTKTGAKSGVNNHYRTKEEYKILTLPLTNYCITSKNRIVLLEYNSLNQYLKSFYDINKPSIITTHKDSAFFRIHALPVSPTLPAWDIFKSYEYKIEKGNKATDWSPAPEDIDIAINNNKAEINTVKAAQSTLEQSITQQETRITTSYKSEISNVKSELNNKIVLNSSAITRLETSISDAEKSIAATNENVSSSFTSSKKYTDSKILEETSNRVLDVNAKLELAKTDAQTKADAAAKAAKDYANAQDLANLNAAKTDAHAKATAAETAAKTHAELKAEAARITAQAHADGIVTAEEQARINDVNAKLALAKTDAQTKADAAAKAAKDYSDLKLNENKTAVSNKFDDINNDLFGGYTSKTSYSSKNRFITDNIITKLAIKDFILSEQSLAQEQLTQEALINLELEVNTKTLEAQQAAKDYADLKAEAARISAEAHADGIVTAEEQARINDVNAKLELAKTDAQNKADAAAKAAKDYSDLNLKDKTEVKDTRNDNQIPSWYRSNYSKTTVKEFKLSSAIGLTGATYSLLETEVPYHNSSGGAIYQRAINNNKIYYRYGVTTSWSEWTLQEDVIESQKKADAALILAKADAQEKAEQAKQDALKDSKIYSDAQLGSFKESYTADKTATAKRIDDTRTIIAEGAALRNYVANNTTTDYWSKLLGDGTVSYNALYAQLGTNSAANSDTVYFVRDELIPLAKNTLYKLTFSIQNKFANSRFYLGAVGFAADGKTYVNTTGANRSTPQFYCYTDTAAHSKINDITCYLATSDDIYIANLPNALRTHQNVVFIKALIYANVGTKGSLIVDNVKVEIVDSVLSAQVRQISESVDGINASASLMTDVNGKISGWKVNNTGKTSNFDIIANNFKISNSSTSTAISPFRVLGNNTYINNVMIENGSIDNTKIKDASISLAKIDTATITSLSALSATIGHFKSSKTGARLEIKDSLLSVYDANNVLRVKLGLW